MVTINIDGKQYSVEPQRNLLDTCLSLGFDIPYFCFHPALGSVGSCRLCAVKRFRDVNDTKGRIVMSCMEPVSDGMIISTTDEEVKEFRASIIESLMTNHPHDCPICDEGGECHLQDMVVMTGHNYRKYDFKKRTYKNQYLGPYINHEMNRCIQCYRCVRFYKDYAGGKDFGVFGSHNHLYFGRFEDGKLESDFSGNLVEVCPTGVFTDKTLKKHYTRKWDLTNAPGICTQCSTGCNIIIGERYGSIRRILNRYNHQVNGYFLCDKGRFGYEFINSETRIRQSLYKSNKNSPATAIDSNIALKKAIEIIAAGKTIGIGSPSASLEANYTLRKLVGKENFYSGSNSTDHTLTKEIIQIYQSGKVHVPSIKEIENAEAVIILGEDILQSAPRVALAVRQSVKNKPMDIAVKQNIPQWNSIAKNLSIGESKGPLIVVTTEPTEFDEIGLVVLRKKSQDIGTLGNAITAAISGNFNNIILDGEEKKSILKISESLKECNSVVVISGTQCKNKDIIDASAKIAYALTDAGKSVGLYFVVQECNSLGMEILANNSIDQALEKIEKGEVDTMVVLENDLFHRTDKEKLSATFEKCKNIIVLDHSQSETTNKADLILASGTFAENEGTIISSEGRMQRYFSAIPANTEIRQSWKWLIDIFASKHSTEKIGFDSLLNEISTEVPILSKIKEVAPEAGYREQGMKIPRQTPRYSGRTSMLANVNVSEQKPPQDDNSALAYSMEGSRALPPSELLSYYWSPGWNSAQASNKYLKELNNALKGKDPGIRIFK
jgi:NADH-quinone oxidoreductase subunit G